MKDARIFIIHIRDCISRIETYTAEGKATFFDDLRTQDAVIRNLETMADATQQLPDSWKSAYPQIDWRKISDFRNFLAHQYLDINLNIVWDAVEKSLPELKDCIDLMSKQFWND